MISTKYILTSILSVLIMSVSFGQCNITLTYTTPTYDPPPTGGPAYNMANGNISTCGGTFYDPQGTGSYLNSQSYTQTFCSSTPNAQLEFAFTSFSTESCCDHLYIYDGANTSAPLIGTYQGTGTPGTVTSTNGCLTFRWTSDGSVTGTGWQATINCVDVPMPLECTGGNVTLNVLGGGSVVTDMDNDFDGGTAGVGWNTNVQASFTNPCDPSIDGGTYMWMGSSAQHPRIISTAPLDLTCSDQICFYLDFSTQGGASPCEGIDEADEGVFFEYSIDGGTTWVTMEYYGPNGVGDNVNAGGNNPQMTSWNQYCFTIPPVAQTVSTMFHWAQTGSSGAGNDHWGLDNVTIATDPGCTPFWYDYAHTVPSQDDPVQNTTITGETTFSVVYTNGTISCSSSVTIPVPPCPCPDVTLTGGGSYCAGDNIPDVTFAVTGGQFPVTVAYAIDGVAQTPLVLNQATYVITDPVEGDYTILSVTDPTLCVGTFSGTSSVVQNPAPVLNSFTGGDTYCAGEVVSDLIVAASGTGTLTLDYTLDGVAQTQLSGSSPFNLGNAPGVYVLTSLGDAGCTTPVSSTQTIVVNPVPTATAGTSTPTICAGSNILLTSATSTGTYAWTGPNSFTSTSEDPTISGASVNASGTYSLIVTENGCPSLPSTVNVTVNPSPTVSTNADMTICDGTSVTLSGQGATTYSWDNSVTNGGTFTPAVGTITYTVTGTTSGCTGTASVTVTVLPLPVADATPSVTSGYPPLAVTFTNNSTDATSYLWNFGTGLTSTATNTTSTFNTPGTYQVTLVASNGVCDSTWTDFIIVIPYPAMTIQVPNVFSPNGDNSNEEYVISVVNGKVFHATILNRWGNVMFETDVLNDGWDGKLDGKDADEGVYFVKYHVEGLDATVQEGHTFFHLVR